jgi:probable F420-dependent oxidoreductase
MSPRPFRFAAQVSSAPSMQEWTGLARKLEDLGYSTLTMPDHFSPQLAPVPALMAAADATTELRVGTLVFDNDYKHPLVLAKECATLDLLSGGRLELGLGAGWEKSDYDHSGIPYDPPKVRVDRFEEGLAVIKGCLGEGPFSFSGEHYRVTDYDGGPKPVQRPHPPILVGGGAKRVLGIAGREADIVGVNFDLRTGAVGPEAIGTGTAEATDQKLAWIRAGAGDRFDDIELQVTVFLAAINDDPRSVADAMAGGVGLTVDQALALPHFLVGTVDEICDTLVERRERWGFSYIAFSSGVSPTAWEDMAPVVARLAGT